ncbi:hypothetical protein RRG08_042806 [Elysia crispata]|uniref:Uncharacterized protein n=1 Tax=Elysia crispata TaxID=231223 RepID=A0AAE0YCE3_9GAST|nr:hypothetical protein RRG08_042806 [Elysia crispata]
MAVKDAIKLQAKPTLLTIYHNAQIKQHHNPADFNSPSPQPPPSGKRQMEGEKVDFSKLAPTAVISAGRVSNPHQLKHKNTGYLRLTHCLNLSDKIGSVELSETGARGDE